jgi:hypothetical protein
MKFTSKDLMKAMGLAVGDTIKLNGKTHTFTAKKDGTLICKNVLKQLIDQDFEILPRPKRVGDLKCEELTCATCPLRAINCGNIATSVKKTLYEILGNFFPEYQDQEIYDLLKARLDKEVEE